MNRHPREIEKRVIEMHFQGVQRDTIARQLGIPPSTVTEILSILPPVLKPLRELSKELRKNNMIPHDALQGVHILNDLRALGIKLDQFSLSLQTVMKISTQAEYEPGDVVQAGLRLIDLETQSGKPYLEALKEFELVNAKTAKKKQQNKRLEARDLQLQAQIEKNEERQAQTFRAANEAPEEISKFKAQKAKFSQHGIAFSDTDTISKLLDNVKEIGNSAKRVVATVKRVGSLERAKAELQKNIEEMNQDLTSLKTQKEIVEQELSQARIQNTKLDNEIRPKQDTFARLDTVIQIRQAQLFSIYADYERIDNLRKEVIAQIGRMMDMNDYEIKSLQLEADLDVASQDLLRRFEAFLDRRLKDYRKQ